ncbi:MAG: UDP-N-acetylglucosamine--N-acetylmuramyl-(pentapeptide) pyrophosphoryl-undecaprenol N-acetylglucosamine transferase [Polyangiaceae bacterium]|nr:UDP-N-acetylglucosamine--N-acetylmuramyl-(pentapeptide) pyrophosphoryl-undecaprenol N-acetylglucosamine transferase [Polyangiaceae bacterium]
MTLRAIFAGGGTGGHVFPLVAVCEALRRELGGELDATFVGSARGMEAQLIPARGERLELLPAHPIKGGGLSGAARGAWTAARSIPAARALVSRLAPGVVLSIGGYAAGSVTLAARTLGVPVALMEPNSVLGLANRLIAPLVSRAYLVFPEAGARLSPDISRVFGMPLRPGFEPSVYAPTGRARVVVLGGSQGAQALNEAVPEAIHLLRARVPHVSVLHQAGRGKDDAVRERYRALGLDEVAETRAFVDDVPGVLRDADVVLARAGAGSVAELCTVGRASILVPFPVAADDHQRKNAEALAASGAAVSVLQAEATPQRLARELTELLGDGARRARMAELARGRGEPDAARKIARDLLALASPAARRAATPSTEAS